MKTQDHYVLTQAASEAQEVLFTANTTFPFVLFPDTITIDRLKVTVIRRTFFRVAEVISIQIPDILNIEEDLGPFFGSLKIYTRFFNNEPLRITFLGRNATRKAKRILQGYVIARQQKIDCSKIPKNELLPLLMKMGTTAKT